MGIRSRESQGWTILEKAKEIKGIRARVENRTTLEKSQLVAKSWN